MPVVLSRYLLKMSKMRPTIKAFMGGFLLIPLLWFVWHSFQNHANKMFDINREICSNEGVEAFGRILDKKYAAAFVMCLKKHTDILSWWYLDPTRLYQVVSPRSPCQLVGLWQVKRDKFDSYGIELTPYGSYRIDTQLLSQRGSSLSLQQKDYDGVWSSPSLNRILWFHNSVFWPIDDNKVEWLNADQFVIDDKKGTKTYYQRVSSRVPNCPAYPPN